VTFAEQIPELTIRYGRRSPGLAAVLRAVALALGGRAGARMPAQLAAEVSRVTLIRLIRLIRALPEPAVTQAPRVLGVDEFALRRGHSCGTLLAGVETRRPVDILPERSADSFAAWLEARPGTELICRDRAGCYADGGTRGAPAAIQVADRWHLWHNLGDAVERAVARHCGCLRAAVTALPAARPPQPAETGIPASASPARSDRIAVRTRQRHAAIRQLLADGLTVRAAAAQLGLARNTVRRFARAASPEELLVHDGTGRRASILGEHKACLRERWNSGCTDAAVLHRELRARGYPSGYSLIRDYLASLRGAAMPAPAPAVPKARAVTRWTMTRPASLPPADQAQLEAILRQCPELAGVTAHVRALAAMMTGRRGRDLQDWIPPPPPAAIPHCGPSSPACAATRTPSPPACLTLPWSSSAVEAHVNRIKMLKRQMYGRANPDLLRRRVLLADWRPRDPSRNLCQSHSSGVADTLRVPPHVRPIAAHAHQPRAFPAACGPETRSLWPAGHAREPPAVRSQLLPQGLSQTLLAGRKGDGPPASIRGGAVSAYRHLSSPGRSSCWLMKTHWLAAGVRTRTRTPTPSTQAPPCQPGCAN
jgi:transposase